MNKLVIRRLLAGMIDYGFVMIYAMILLAFFSGLYFLIQVNPAEVHPLLAQGMGFFVLTLPVFFYFFKAESGSHQGTFGKRLMRIKVVSGSIFIRNFLKLLPWEVGHAGVHWMIFYAEKGQEVPLWVWVLLILPQLVMLLYWASIIIYKGKSSLYDLVAKCFLHQG
ncbi:RDD family protein [Echinicola sp. CAU 1574]|uniref:RDD family protein n=1 Tax=Echinicola arenosa TaxID=2774144 RepID=A0ABR9AJ43_9BACT|nr:RDD family protein [Echinicola arenosa]MBD8488849.1 RDD family protein [Echinicola arenosa]